MTVHARLALPLVPFLPFTTWPYHLQVQLYADYACIHITISQINLYGSVESCERSNVIALACLLLLHYLCLSIVVWLTVMPGQCTQSDTYTYSDWLIDLSSTVIQLNSSLQAHLTDRPSEVLLEASWTMNCSDFQQDSDSCFGLVDHFTLRCRQDSSMEEEIVEGRSQCDGVVSEGKVSVTGLESSRYLCNLTALSSEGDIVAEDELNISTPQTSKHRLNQYYTWIQCPFLRL